MKFQEYKNRLTQILDTCLLLKKQINALSVLNSCYIAEKNSDGMEHIITYDLPELWQDYSFKLKKCVYFLEQYCHGILNELEHIPPQEGDIRVAAGPYLEEAIFNFDAFVLSASGVMEYDERDYLTKYFKKAQIINIYPSREEIGLYQQLNILRNRIIHHTGGRYVNGEKCQRFVDFSTRVKMIRIVDGNIMLCSTQLDVQKDAVKEVLPIAVAKARETGKNVFDILFPAKSGKGHGKNSPIMIVPNKDIYFDHADAGVNMVSQIQDFISNMNQAFFEELCYKSGKKEDYSDLCVGFCNNGDIDSYLVKSVFNIQF